MLSYFPLLQCLAIPRAIVLSHFSLLQRSGQLSHFVKWLSHFSKMLNHFAKLLSHSRDSINHSLEWLMWAHGLKDGSQLGQGGARAGGGSIEGVWRRVARSCARAAELSQCGGTRACAGWLGRFVGRVQMINSSTLYIYAIHHPGPSPTPTNRSIDRVRGTHARPNPTCAHASQTPLHALIESMRPDRVDRPHAQSTPCNSAIFWCRLVIPLYRQSFCCNKLSHFSSLNSAILL
jgi:hypothetical protein